MDVYASGRFCLRLLCVCDLAAATPLCVRRMRVLLLPVPRRVLVCQKPHSHTPTRGKMHEGKCTDATCLHWLVHSPEKPQTRVYTSITTLAHMHTHTLRHCSSLQIPGHRRVVGIHTEHGPLGHMRAGGSAVYREVRVGVGRCGCGCMRVGLCMVMRPPLVPLFSTTTYPSPPQPCRHHCLYTGTSGTAFTLQFYAWSRSSWASARSRPSWAVRGQPARRH